MGEIINFERKTKEKWLAETGYVKVNLFGDEDGFQYLYRWYYDDYGAQIVFDALEVELMAFINLKDAHAYFIEGCMRDIQKL